ncbi:hypothetical protein ACU686_19980 [Yinghuangia aomiensis]
MRYSETISASGTRRGFPREWATARQSASAPVGAYLLCRDRHLAEDLTQTTLAKLYSVWHRVRDSEKREAYARRTLCAQLRRRNPARLPARVRGRPGCPRLPHRRPTAICAWRCSRPSLTCRPRARAVIAAALLGGPERRSDRRRARLHGGHGQKPDLARPRDAASTPAAPTTHSRTCSARLTAAGPGRRTGGTHDTDGRRSVTGHGNGDRAQEDLLRRALTDAMDGAAGPEPGMPDLPGPAMAEGTRIRRRRRATLPCRAVHGGGAGRGRGRRRVGVCRAGLREDGSGVRRVGSPPGSRPARRWPPCSTAISPQGMVGEPRADRGADRCQGGKTVKVLVRDAERRTGVLELSVARMKRPLDPGQTLATDCGMLRKLDPTGPESGAHVPTLCEFVAERANGRWRGTC